MTIDMQRIYVASLSDYNAGFLHGVWVDLTEVADIDEVWAKVNAMLKASPATKKYGDVAEEWAIHDYEGFGSYRVSEYDAFDKLLMISQALANKGEAFLVWVGNDSTVLDTDGDIEEAFDEQYAGEWDDDEAFARNMIEELGLPDVGTEAYVKVGWGEEKKLNIFELLDSYLDWGALTRSTMEDHWSGKLSDGNVAVFRNY